MANAVPRHRKPPRTAPSSRRRHAAGPSAGRRVAKLAIASGSALIIGAGAAAAVTFLPLRLGGGAGSHTGSGPVANSLGIVLADAITTKQFPAATPTPRATASHRAAHRGQHATRHPARTVARARRKPAPAPPVYLNPLRDVSGLIPERIDMGVDFGGTGPVYAIGDGVVTNATGANSGWPGGGWITYQLTDGPATGLVVYVAEDVTPAVAVGQKVTPDTVVANMYDGGDGIETGWAMPDGASAESQLAAAGGIGGSGPFPTLVGDSFEDLLTALGVPAAPNAGDTPSGILPAGYLTSWPGLG